jgi:tetratricopeptide (TPR) repeat protein
MALRLSIVALATLFLGFAGMASASELNDVIAELLHAWAKGCYSTPAKQQEKYFAELQRKAHQVTKQFPGRAEVLIWEGIITGTHARYQDFLSAGVTAEKARDVLLAAEKIDPNALNGSGLTTLGSLYYKVPRGISFGDPDKARAYLERSLKIDPSGIDQNFFYGEFLAEEGDRAKAIEYLKKALAAPLRPGFEDADAGRHAEAQELLEKLSK